MLEILTEFLGTSIKNKHICICGFQCHSVHNFAYGTETKYDRWIISCVGTLWPNLAKIFCLVILISQSNDDYCLCVTLSKMPRGGII